MNVWLNTGILLAGCIASGAVSLYLLKRRMEAVENRISAANGLLLLGVNLLCWAGFVVFTPSDFPGGLWLLAVAACALAVPFVNRFGVWIEFALYAAAAFATGWLWFGLPVWQALAVSAVWTAFTGMWQAFNRNEDSTARSGLSYILFGVVFLSIVYSEVSYNEVFLALVTATVLFTFAVLCRYPASMYMSAASLRGFAFLTGFFLAYFFSKGYYMAAVLLPLYFLVELSIRGFLLLVNRLFGKDYPTYFFYQRALLQGANITAVNKSVFTVCAFLACLGIIAVPTVNVALLVLAFLIIFKFLHKFGNWHYRTPSYREMFVQTRGDLRNAFAEIGKNVKELVNKKKGGQ